MANRRGSYAGLHEVLVKKGYSYSSSRGKDKTYVNRKGEKAKIKFVKAGRKGQRVNIRISDNMTMTRRHGTADTYELIMPKKRKGR